MNVPSLRARVRAEMIDEIKSAARRQLATAGANVSLRAIAREMGMVSSAVYRYFASRDDLLTALIVDAYNAAGQAAEQAEAVVDRADLSGRFLALCHGVRDWALEHPHEYALIYGSPVPGYRAPQDTIEPATRISLVLVRILHDAVAADALAPDSARPLPEPVRDDLSVLLRQGFPTVPEAVLARGMTAWIQLFGVISFELFGHLNNVVASRTEFFDHQMRVMLDQVGLLSHTGDTRPPGTAAT